VLGSAAQAPEARQTDPTANAIVFFLKFTPSSPSTLRYCFLWRAEGSQTPAGLSLRDKKTKVNLIDKKSHLR
jgi:hypothetical protein